MSPSSAHPPFAPPPPPSTARAFWVEAPGAGAIREEPLAIRGSDDVLVQMLASGISRGTETLVFAGRVPASQRAIMRCPHQAGAFPAPVKYGYGAVGRVLDGPDALRGRAVFALHPHQTHFVVPATAVVPVPEAVPAERAVLTANMETALNGVWDAGIAAGDRVCVVGAGVVGLLTAFLAAATPGTEVVVVDVDADKAAVAAALGLAFAPAGDERLGGFDVVVHASGNPAGLQQALALAGFEATIVELSWYGDRAVTLPLGEAFHSQRLTLRSSQVGTLPAARRARWNHRRRLQAALALLADPRLDRLIYPDVGFEDLPTVMRALTAGDLPALCCRVRYQGFTL